MKVTYSQGNFICLSNFESRHIPKNAGFRWNADNKVWYTPSPSTALKLKEHLDEVAKREITKKCLVIEEWEKDLVVPKNETLLDFQKNAVKFALARNKSYLALDPGLGKTPIAAIISQTLYKSKPVFIIYICPPFLARNTVDEFRRFAPGLRTDRLTKTPSLSWGNVCVIPDSMITKDWVLEQIRKYTKMASHGAEAILFVDEAHRFKSDLAARTMALFGSKEKRGLTSFFHRVVFLSGTPMPNRPIELFPVLSNAAPETIDYMNKFEYGKKYCDAFQGAWGWDFSGCSNLPELVSRVVPKFMLRYKKADVLKELPPKIQEMVLVDGDLPPSMSKLSRAILNQYSPEDLMKGGIAAHLGVEEHELHLATYRRELGTYKAPFAAQYIDYILEEFDESVLVFAIHKDVVKILSEELSKYSPFVVTGETPMEVRHEYVKEFQKSKSRRLFIGNIQAAGVGLTLTKATRIIFVEFSWVPSDNDQASDRAHRIGQKESVLVQYLVQKDSVDKAVMETVLRKKKITEQL